MSRKNLDLRSDISEDVEDNLVVLGDPGRVRQIITNLFTNSIKFTHQGYVKPAPDALIFPEPWHHPLHASPAE